jgi:hypothetical protein
MEDLEELFKVSSGGFQEIKWMCIVELGKKRRLGIRKDTLQD